MAVVVVVVRGSSWRPRFESRPLNGETENMRKEAFVRYLAQPIPRSGHLRPCLLSASVVTFADAAILIHTSFC